jgi:hypothetical protein
MHDRDVAMSIFLDLAESSEFKIPREVLIKVYEIQKHHQFDEPDERVRSLKEMQSVIEDWLHSSNELNAP